MSTLSKNNICLKYGIGLPPFLMMLLMLMTSQAQAQSGNVAFSNPSGIAKPTGYSHVVEITNPQRIVYIAGQVGLDSEGKLVGEPGDFRAQAQQAFENLKTALDSVGGRFENIVKLNMYLVDISTHLPTLREVRDTYMNTATPPPASTTVGVSGLAVPGLLFEVEAIVVLPSKP